ncbi:kinase-like protein, partial [Punctularia strigosozonata HHB-11173 SS5]
VNILIDNTGRPRLADFGLSRILSEYATQVATQNHQGGRWTAPELLCPERFSSQSNPTSKPTFEGDVYSFACVCYEIYTTRPPFYEIRREATVIVRILEGQRPRRPMNGDGCAITPSDTLWSLIEKCWHQQSELRPKMTTVLQQL